MKIAFRVEAGSNIGMGHITRCMAIANELKAWGWSCTFLIKSEKNVINYIINNKFDYITVPDMMIEDELYWIKNIIKDYKVVFLDSYLLSSSYIEAISADNIVCCYDDNALYKYSCDVVLNPNLYAKDLEFIFGMKKPKLLLGADYCILRDQFRTADKIKIRKNATNIFICLGGSDMNNMTEEVVRRLQDIPNIKLVVVIGALNNHYENIKGISKNNVTLIRDPKSMVDYMKQCDIGIISSGSIVYELCAIGLPAIVIAQAANQMGIYNYINKNNMMEGLGDWKSIDFEQLYVSTCNLLNDFEKRKTQSERITNSVNKNGVAKVASVLANMVENY